MSVVALSIFRCVAAASSSSACFSAIAASNLACISSSFACTFASSSSAAFFSFIATFSSASAARQHEIFGSTTFATKWYVFIAIAPVAQTRDGAGRLLRHLEVEVRRVQSTARRSSHVSSLICSFGKFISLPRGNCVSPIIFIGRLS